MKLKHYYFPVGVMVGIFCFFSINVQPTVGVIGISEESDAIAVRVLPNPNHYSAVRWYQSQNFSGSPQSLLVDGYDAVRDGRTVYVNAANIDEVNKKIYTNIYLISYNQDSNVKTVDVLGQIIKHWRFNNNLSSIGHCQISTLVCRSAADCSQGYACSGNSDAPGRCQPTAAITCATDADCASGLYCDSLRAKVARDVRRLGMLGDLRESLSSFKKKNNKYPMLGAGTYLALSSISTWPSWQALFLPQLGSSQSLVDPINSLGSCAGYDTTTCWNAETKTFADPNPNNNILELPGGSYAFVFSGDKNGSNYSLCAAIETKSLGYSTADDENKLVDSGCVSSGGGYNGASSNQPPVLIATNLQGEQGQEFNGYIKVVDPENNPLAWQISGAGISWYHWQNNNQMNQAPILQDTINPNQKKIYAQVAGDPGTYNLALTVTDGQGASGTLATITPITIINHAPVVQADDIEYYPSTVIPLTLKFSLTDKNQPFSYTVAKASFNSGPFDLLSPAYSQLISSSSNIVGDTVTYTLKYNLLLSTKITADTNFVYVITGKDKYNAAATRQINLMVKADPPTLDFSCPQITRLGTGYYCSLGWKNQGDHTLSYTAVGALPPGLIIVNGSDQGNIFYTLQGTTTVATSSYPIKIKAVNEYGATAQRNFNLSINTYCGDHFRQTPNSEGQGGFYNDGQEDCDGNSGVLQDRSHIASSSPSLQYGCTTNYSDIVPYPIIGNQAYCTYLAPDAGGGYCGDGICQYEIMRNGAATLWEGGGACPEDCTCNGEHQTNQGGTCTCDSGWYDCDGNPGCESNTDCGNGGGGGNCPQGQYECLGACYPTQQYQCLGVCYSSEQYECGGQCFPKAGNNYRCTPYPSQKCYMADGQGAQNCHANCASGYFNCDGYFGCEATTCTCGAGAHFNQNSGHCECDNSGWLMCGGDCYNPNTSACCGTTIYDPYYQKCCGAGFGDLTCAIDHTPPLLPSYCCPGNNGGSPFCGMTVNGNNCGGIWHK